MRRRDFLRQTLMGTTGLAAGLRLPLALGADYSGKFFITVQADGGWDPTSLCDPKINLPGELPINNWADRADVMQAGNIPYAPFAANQAFFEKYYDRMLVINGVDAQTNSHTVGVVHNWSGRTSEGFPSITALLAAHHAPSLAMSYLNFGGYAQTGGVTRYTRIDNPSQVRNIALPNTSPWDPDFYNVDPADWDLLRSFREDRLAQMAAEPRLMPRAQRNRGYYQSALAGSEELGRFAALVPPDEELEQPDEGPNYWNAMRQQAQVALLAFKSGVSVSADLHVGGFDTHQQHDQNHEPLMASMTNAIDYLWDYAEALELADRLVVVIASDFGRTPHYNADDGKDHWPISSVVVMEKNQPWTNRVVGETDGGHNAFKINPMTLERDVAGTIIYPKHVHKALRSYLGIGNSPVSAPFPFNNTEDFAFFS